MRYSHATAHIGPSCLVYDLDTHKVWVLYYRNGFRYFIRHYANAFSHPPWVLSVRHRCAHKAQRTFWHPLPVRTPAPSLISPDGISMALLGPHCHLTCEASSPLQQ